MAFVSREVHQSLGRERMLERLARGESYAQHAERELGSSLHVANTHRLRKRQTGVTIRLLGHFHTVKCRVVQAELVVKGWLFQEDFAAIGQNLGNGLAILGAKPLDAEVADVVEEPYAERLTRDAAAGRIVNHGPLFLDGHDPRVGEFTVAAVGVEPAHGEKSAQYASIAEPEHDVAVLENLTAPLVPAGHLRRDLDGRHRAFAACSAGFRSPVIALISLRNHSIRHLPRFGRIKVKGQEHQEKFDHYRLATWSNICAAP